MLQAEVAQVKNQTVLFQATTALANVPQAVVMLAEAVPADLAPTVHHQNLVEVVVVLLSKSQLVLALVPTATIAVQVNAMRQ